MCMVQVYGGVVAFRDNFFVSVHKNLFIGPVAVLLPVAMCALTVDYAMHCEHLFRKKCVFQPHTHMPAVADI